MWIPKHEIPDILVSFIRASLSNRTKLTNLLEEWLAEHPGPKNTEAQLFPVTYTWFATRLAKLVREAIGKKVHPHMLRHSSATYWAAKMNRYQLWAKY
jgi:integrase